MIRYFLLLKRLLKKKSYIVMLLVVPLMVLLLKLIGTADAGLMTIGLYIEGDGQISQQLKADMLDNPGNFRFIEYQNSNSLTKDVENKTLNEGWMIPASVDEDPLSTKYVVIIRENGISHMLAKEVLLSRIYPYYAEAFMENYVAERQLSMFDEATQKQILEQLSNSFDSIEVNGDLFEMGYLDGACDSEAESDDSSFLLLPLRGILALHLMLCAIAASMYYLEDNENGLFIFWRTRFRFLREVLYYLVILAIPSVMMLLGLLMGGVFTTLPQEVIKLLVYELLLIGLASFFRHILKSTRRQGLSLPVVIFSSAIFSPVFIEFKEAGMLRMIFPSFHYLYSIHDLHYLGTMAIYAGAALFISCILAEFCYTSS